LWDAPYHRFREYNRLGWQIGHGRYGDYRTSRTSGHLSGLFAQSGLEFAYPQPLRPAAQWVAEDLVSGTSNGASPVECLAGEDWHVIITTWDGSEIPADNAGDDRNMKIFVDDLDQNAMRQGPRGL
jgi:hypothetical protein